MTRFPDWQLRFEAIVRARQHEPLAWGRNDCANFAADVVEALTGVRHFPELRGLPVRDALAVMRAMGGVCGIATAALGEPVRPLLANVGDVVAINSGKREALAVCNGATAMGPGAQGLVHVSMMQAIAAWRVG